MIRSPALAGGLFLERHMVVLAVTGGIATGKSTVMRMLAGLGASTMSADALAHDLLSPGTELTRRVLSAFPGCAASPDTVDRRTLGQVVFGDALARRQLEALLHPPIIAALRAQVDVWRSLNIAGALEIPLLFETGLRDIADRVVVVMCRPETQFTRVLARLNGDAEEANRWITAQWPLADKEAAADFVIRTDGTEDDTRRQVERLWQQTTS